MAEVLHFIGLFLLVFALFYYINNFQEINKEFKVNIKQWVKDAREMYAEVYGPYVYQVKETLPFIKKSDKCKHQYHPNVKYHRRMMKPNKE